MYSRVDLLPQISLEKGAVKANTTSILRGLKNGHRYDRFPRDNVTILLLLATMVLVLPATSCQTIFSGSIHFFSGNGTDYELCENTTSINQNIPQMIKECLIGYNTEPFYSNSYKFIKEVGKLSLWRGENQSPQERLEKCLISLMNDINLYTTKNILLLLAMMLISAVIVLSCMYGIIKFNAQWRNANNHPNLPADLEGGNEEVVNEAQTLPVIENANEESALISVRQNRRGPS